MAKSTIRQTVRALAWCSVAGIFSTASQAASPDLEALTRLLSSDNPQAAYEKAKGLQAAMEGEPDFDYLFAVAALRTGHLSEGVLALERVVSLQPENLKARIELAKGYYAIGDNVRARREFERAMPLVTAEDKQQIKSYLAAIRQREMHYESSAKGYIQLGAGFDSNINSAPDNDLVDTLIPIHLGSNAIDKKDGFYELALGANIDHPVTRRLALYGELNGRLRNYRDEHTYDNGLYGGQFGAKWSYKSYLIKATALLQQFRVDANVNRNSGGMTLEALNGFTPYDSVGAAFNYMDFTFPDQPLRDSNQFTLGTTWVHRWPSRSEATAYLGAYGGKEIAKQDSDNARSVADRKLYGIQTGFSYKLSDAWGARLSVLGQQSNYSAPFLAIPTLPKRDERLLVSELSLAWIVAPQWKTTASYSYSSNSSNIDMYNYARRQFGVDLRREF